MIEEYVLKVIIPDALDAGFYNLYMFSRISKTLLPIKIDKWACEAVLLAKQKKLSSRPHTHDTVCRLVRALGGEVKCILVYKVLDDVFYAYTRILKNNEFVDIDMKVTDALSIALRCGKPVMISENVYKKVGIKVTRELIERSLKL